MEKIKSLLNKELLRKVILKKERIFKVWHLLVFLMIVGAGGDSGVEGGNSKKDCLVGHPWGYPSASSATSAWRFSQDGTFSFTATGYLGSKSRGNWTISGDKVHIKYNWNSSGMTLPNQTLTLNGCNTLMAGSSTYKK